MKDDSNVEFSSQGIIECKHKCKYSVHYWSSDQTTQLKERKYEIIEYLAFIKWFLNNKLFKNYKKLYWRVLIK